MDCSCISVSGAGHLVKIDEIKNAKVSSDFDPPNNTICQQLNFSILTVLLDRRKKKTKQKTHIVENYQPWIGLPRALTSTLLKHVRLC